jgi:hypothetical protein
MRDSKKISFYELQNMHSSELKKKYKMNDRQLEQSMRNHMDGANREERSQFYKEVWDSKDKS